MDDHKPAYFAKHETDDDRRFAEQKELILQRPNKEEMDGILDAAFERLIQRKGAGAVKRLLIIASIVGALVVIFGGLKSLLGWLGIIISR